MSNVHSSRSVKIAQLRLGLTTLLIRRKDKHRKIKLKTVTKLEKSQLEEFAPPRPPYPHPPENKGKKGISPQQEELTRFKGNIYERKGQGYVR